MPLRRGTCPTKFPSGGPHVQDYSRLRQRACRRHALGCSRTGRNGEKPAPHGTAADEQPGDIIVTGSTRAERRFDVSYAINTLSQDDVAKIAPVNMADLIGQLPGFQTEATGGEVQNIYRLRGLPSDGSFVAFQQDGITLFQENDGYFWRGDALIKYDLMSDRVEVVRGGPAPIYASNSAAIINQITVTGSDTPRGKAQVTIGDTGLYRLDAYQAGPINSNTYYAIGGFLRYHDGYRDNGFPNDKGGQLRANIKHNFDNGSIKLSLNYVNDHNVFYLPIPVADPTNPSVSLNKYLNYFTGTLNTPELRNVTLQYRDGNGNIQSRNSDLSDGRHMRMVNVGRAVRSDVWRLAGYGQGRVHAGQAGFCRALFDHQPLRCQYLCRQLPEQGQSRVRQ